MKTYHIPGNSNITVQIFEPVMKRDEIGQMRLRYSYTVEWVEGVQTCFFGSDWNNEYIYTPVGTISADAVLESLASFMGNCAETTDMEFHRMDGSCSDNFHMMSESIGEDVQAYIWENSDNEG